MVEAAHQRGLSGGECVEGTVAQHDPVALGGIGFEAELGEDVAYHGELVLVVRRVVAPVVRRVVAPVVRRTARTVVFTAARAVGVVATREVPAVADPPLVGAASGGTVRVGGLLGHGVDEDLADELVPPVRHGDDDRIVEGDVDPGCPAAPSRPAPRVEPGAEQPGVDELVEVERSEVAGDPLAVGGLLAGDGMVLPAYELVQRPAHRVDQCAHGLPAVASHARRLTPTVVVEILGRWVQDAVQDQRPLVKLGAVAMTGELEQAKRPVTALAGPYGHPIHPALVALPIGAWVSAFVFDLGSRFVADPAFLSQGARWLIAIGVVGALAAAGAGFLDFFAIPTGTPAHRTALLHMALNLTVTVAYAVNFVLRGAAGRGPVGWGPIALAAVSLALLAGSGYLGGKLAYRFGVRVAAETTQAEGYRTAPASTPPADGIEPSR